MTAKLAFIPAGALPNPEAPTVAELNAALENPDTLVLEGTGRFIMGGCHPDAQIEFTRIFAEEE